MFKVSPTILETFTDTPNCVPEDRVQHRTVHIPNVSCDGHLQINNCVGIVSHCNRHFLITLYNAVTGFTDPKIYLWHIWQEHKTVPILHCSVQVRGLKSTFYWRKMEVILKLFNLELLREKNSLFQVVMTHWATTDHTEDLQVHFIDEHWK